jgi:hypothetical protein
MSAFLVFFVVSLFSFGVGYVCATAKAVKQINALTDDILKDLHAAGLE